MKTEKERYIDHHKKIINRKDKNQAIKIGESCFIAGLLLAGIGVLFAGLWIVFKAAWLVAAFTW